MAFDPNYPCGWNYEGSMSTHWTSFLNLLQHKAGNLVVVLMEEMHGYNMCIYWALETWMTSVWYPQPVCTTSSWWQQSPYCGKQTSAGNPGSKEGETAIKMKYWTCFYFCSVKDVKQMFRTTALLLVSKRIISTHLPTLSAFAFLSSPMHPVMANHNRLSTHKKHSRNLQHSEFNERECLWLWPYDDPAAAASLNPPKNSEKERNQNSPLEYFWILIPWMMVYTWN